MYDLRQIIKGLSMFVDNDILPKVSGWQKWVIGAGMGVALDKSVNIFEELKNNEMVKMLGIIDRNDNVDVDTLYKEIKKQAQKSSVTFNIPMLGILTLNDKDVDKIYEYIKMEN